MLAINRTRVVVVQARRKGLLEPQPCEHSGCPRTNVVAHHDDYAKPLEVRWLCRLHHTHWHSENQALNRWTEEDEL